jgi:hypothetical protein
MVARPARWKLVMSACGLALLAAGCGSGGSSGSTSAAGNSSPASSPASSASPASPASGAANSALCADAAALRASVDKLRHITVGAGTASEITADLKEVKAALTTFIQDAHGQWQAQTSALSSAIATLSTAVSSLTASPGVGTVSGVVAALGGVSTAAQNLLAAVNPSCLSASASPSA